MKIDALVAAFADDPGSLDCGELDALVDAMRAAPDLVASVKAQLVVAEVLAQELSAERMDFPAQIRERIRAESSARPFLRSVRRRLRRRARSRRIRRAALVGLSLAACVLLAVGLALRTSDLPPAGPPAPEEPRAMASVREASGEALLGRGDTQEAVREGLPLRASDVLVLGDGARVAVVFWPSRIEASLLGPATVGLELGPDARVRLDRGGIDCAVPSGRAFAVATPHATACVRGTKFGLRVGPQRTEMWVVKGVVTLQAGPSGVPVGAGESAEADGSAVRMRSAAAVIADFEPGEKDIWRVHDSTEKSRRLEFVPGTAFGGRAARVRQTSSAGWLAISPFRPPVDWSTRRGVGFWIRGSASGAPMVLEVFDAAPRADARGHEERFVYSFRDESSEWRYVYAPFDEFTRREDWQPEGAPDDGFGRRRVTGIGMFFKKARGEFLIDRIAVH